MQHTVDKIELFDFVKAFFDRTSNVYEKLTSKAKTGNAFMFSVLLSQKYSDVLLRIGELNATKIDALRHALVLSGNKKVPSWLYTKAKNDALKLAATQDAEAITAIKRAYKLTDRDLQWIDVTELANEISLQKNQECKPKKR